MSVRVQVKSNVMPVKVEVGELSFVTCVMVNLVEFASGAVRWRFSAMNVKTA